MVTGFRSFAKSELRGLRLQAGGGHPLPVRSGLHHRQDPPPGVRLRGGQVLGGGLGRPLLHAPGAGDRREPAEGRRGGGRAADAREQEAEERGVPVSESGDEALIDPSRYQPTDWKPKRARFEMFAEQALKTVELRNAKLAGLFTPRYAQPVTTGKGVPLLLPAGTDRAGHRARLRRRGGVLLLAAGAPPERAGPGAGGLRRAPRRRAVRRRGQPDRASHERDRDDRHRAAASRCWR